MALKLMYITNRPDVALIAEKYGVDRIWIDLETLGKEDRQKGMKTVKSRHTIEDIKKIKPLLSKSEMLVRVNPWNRNSQQEINDVIAAGADIIMLPMWKSVSEVKNFLSAVAGRSKTLLLLETKEAVECLPEVLASCHMDEIHIGLNDLHLSYGMHFIFEPLANGMVESIAGMARAKGIPYGFGGIAKLGDGLLLAEKVITEHYRLGSTRAILSRTFCDTEKIDSADEIEKVFRENINKLRLFEKQVENNTESEFEANREAVVKVVNEITGVIKRREQT